MAKVDPYGCWDGAIDDSIAPDEDLDSALGSILDFADFPMEGLEGNVFAEDWDASKSPYHLFGPIPADIPPMDVLLGPPKIETGAPPVSMHRPPVTFVSSHLYFEVLVWLIVFEFIIIWMLCGYFSYKQSIMTSVCQNIVICCHFVFVPIKSGAYVFFFCQADSKGQMLAFTFLHLNHVKRFKQYLSIESQFLAVKNLK